MMRKVDAFQIRSVSQQKIDRVIPTYPMRRPIQSDALLTVRNARLAKTMPEPPLAKPIIASIMLNSTPIFIQAIPPILDESLIDGHSRRRRSRKTRTIRTVVKYHTKSCKAAKSIRVRLVKNDQMVLSRLVGNMIIGPQPGKKALHIVYQRI
jgi:hypothetical protein